MNQKTVENFIMLLKQVKSPNLFNPYTDICPVHDIGKGSPEIRVNNLRSYFTLLKTSDVLLMGEAAGYLGCRRTGLAFTDERTYRILKQNFGITLFKATKSGKEKEMSATYVWSVLRKLVNPPFLWNIVPFHPHEPNNPLSNRTPTKEDHEAVKDVVKYFLDNTTFTQIFAVGNVAKKKLKELKYDVNYIRHPSYGGANKFKATILENFEKKPMENKLGKWL